MGLARFRSVLVVLAILALEFVLPIVLGDELNSFPLQCVGIAL